MQTAPHRWAISAAIALAFVVVSSAGAWQEPVPKDAGQAVPAKGKAGAKPAPKAGLRAGGPALPKAQFNEDLTGDPLARAYAAQGRPPWPYHFLFKITGQDGISLAATYYPARPRTNAGILLLIHQTGTGHSTKDFQEPIEGLEPSQSIVEYLQSKDFAILAIDLRGHGESGLRRELAGRDWSILAGDLRSAYLFLVDRHNRQEINLARLGVFATGDSCLLATAWSASSNGPISGPNRLSDLAALVLVSPVAESQGLRLDPLLGTLAPRVPTLLVAGDRDAELARASQKIIERNRFGKVAFFETRLQADRLIRFEPKVVETIAKFLDEPIKFRASVPWEPRYLLTPVVVSNARVVVPKKPANEPTKKAEPPKKEAQP